MRVESDLADYIVRTWGPAVLRAYMVWVERKKALDNAYWGSILTYSCSSCEVATIWKENPHPLNNGRVRHPDRRLTGNEKVVEGYDEAETYEAGT